MPSPPVGVSGFGSAPASGVSDVSGVPVSSPKAVVATGVGVAVGSVAITVFASVAVMVGLAPGCTVGSGVEVAPAVGVACAACLPAGR